MRNDVLIVANVFARKFLLSLSRALALARVLSSKNVDRKMFLELSTKPDESYTFMK